MRAIAELMRKLCARLCESPRGISPHVACYRGQLGCVVWVVVGKTKPVRVRGPVGERTTLCLRITRMSEYDGGSGLARWQSAHSTTVIILSLADRRLHAPAHARSLHVRWRSDRVLRSTS